MERLTPFFEVNGEKYEIKRTRYLIAEYNKLSNSADLSNEDKTNAIKAQSLIADVQKYATKMKELEDIFFDTLDDEDERKYLKIKELYEKSLDELTKLEVESGSTTKLQKAGIDILEQIAIKGLAEQYFSDGEKVTPKDIEKATPIWESYADKIGNDKTVEWLSGMSECLFGSDDEEEENSFLSQMRKRREDKANIRKKK